VPAPFRADRQMLFPTSAESLWAVLLDTSRYREWWPWIEVFDAGPEPFAAGSRAEFVIRSPLGYRQRCHTVVVDTEPGHLVTVAVGGDLSGPASLAVHPVVDGCRARISWSLSLERRWLRNAARVARPAMGWAHDRVVDRGLAQFRERALTGRGRG
jgi:hypothetical protein